MKLIDILVQELPKRGGWIKGHYQCAQDKNGEVCFYTKGKIHLARYGMWSIPTDSDATHDGESRVVTSLADDYAETIITREQYEAALAASKPEWDGKGLPPVGCECEWQDKNTKAWFPVVIAYSSEWVTVVRELRPLKVGDAVECCINNFGEEKRLQFRPIHSEADKKRDEAIESIKAMLMYDYGDDPRLNDAVILYDAIAAGKIPHIRID